MTAGRRMDAADTAPLPLLPRPLSEDAGLPGARPVRRRTGPPRIEAGYRPVPRHARGIVMAICLLLMALLAALPGLAHACPPSVRTEGASIRLDPASGIERVKMEIGYRRHADRPGAAARTYYQVISAPVTADGSITYRPPMADEIVSAMVLDASGPACD